jgi:putative acyl-CoA dehydrogenase
MEHGAGTHTVFNQTPPLSDYDLFGTDAALQDAVRREGAAAAEADLRVTGTELGQPPRPGAQ